MSCPSCPNCPGPRVPHHCGKQPTLKEQIAALAKTGQRRSRGAPVAACPRPAIYHQWARSSPLVESVSDRSSAVVESLGARVSAAVLEETPSDDTAALPSPTANVRDEERVGTGSKAEVDSSWDDVIQFGSVVQAVCAAVLDDALAGGIASTRALSPRLRCEECVVAGSASETDSTRDDASVLGSVVGVEEHRYEQAPAFYVQSTVVSDERGQLAKGASAAPSLPRVPFERNSGVCVNCPGPRVPHRCGKTPTFQDQLRALKAGKAMKGVKSLGPRPF